MAKLEEMLGPDERVLKTQGKISMMSAPGFPVGDLHLTNKRLIFLLSRGWTAVLTFPGAAIMSHDVILPLEEIKSVSKEGRLPPVLRIRANKVYDFNPSVFRIDEWVDAILQASALSPPSAPPPESPMQYRSAPAYAQPADQKFCSSCGNPLRTENRFCSNCGAPVQ